MLVLSTLARITIYSLEKTSRFVCSSYLKMCMKTYPENHCPQGCTGRVKPPHMQASIDSIFRESGMTDKFHYYYPRALACASAAHHDLICDRNPSWFPTREYAVSALRYEREHYKQVWLAAYVDRSNILRTGRMRIDMLEGKLQSGAILPNEIPTFRPPDG